MLTYKTQIHEIWHKMKNIASKQKKTLKSIGTLLRDTYGGLHVEIIYIRVRRIGFTLNDHFLHIEPHANLVCKNWFNSTHPLYYK